MKRLILFLLLLLLTPTRQPADTYYFPSFFTMPNIGVAHYATHRSHEELDKVGAYWWYKNNAYANMDDNRAIPLIRPFNQSLVQDAISGDYNQFMLVGNEGESTWPAGDNLTPEAMAEFIQAVRGYYPDAFLVCGNSYDLDYLTAVISLILPDTCNAYGGHVTHLVSDVGAWLDDFCLTCEIWVTEIGTCANYDLLYRLTRQANQDSRVRMIFFYTTGEGNPACVNGIDGNGNLTATGQAFKDAIYGGEQ